MFVMLIDLIDEFSQSRTHFHGSAFPNISTNVFLRPDVFDGAKRIGVPLDQIFAIQYIIPMHR